jgi:hypothetical protein
MRMTRSLSTKLYIAALPCSPKIVNKHRNKSATQQSSRGLQQRGGAIFVTIFFVTIFFVTIFWVESKEKLP